MFRALDEVEPAISGNIYFVNFLTMRTSHLNYLEDVYWSRSSWNDAKNAESVYVCP
jgi:hypothetical protein